MIARSAFRFSGYQAATFYANLQLSTGKILPRLLSDLGDVLDGDPITVPVPQDAPPEVPRVLLGSKDQSLRMEMSLVRVDVRWRRQAVGHEMPLDEFITFAQRALGFFHRAVSGRPGRLALVTHRLQLHDVPGRALASHFCRPELLSDEPNRKGPLNRPEKFELHAYKRFQLGEFTVNSWVRCKTGELATEDRRRPIILVEQDLNTLSEALTETEFSDDDIRNFHHRCATESEMILRLYFPDDDKGGLRG